MILSSRKLIQFWMFYSLFFSVSSFASENLQEKGGIPIVSGQPSVVEYSTVPTPSESKLKVNEWQEPGTLASETAGDLPLFTPYGFLLTDINYASHAVNSFGYSNQSAPIAASNQNGTFDQLGRMSFQVQQSRFGAILNPYKNVRGKFEVDFFNPEKSSPTVQAMPRLRIAKIEYTPDPDLTLFLGQDWDIFSPLNPHNFNYVGNYFYGGNVGFFRQQLGFIKQFENYEAAFAVGMAGSNALYTPPATGGSNITGNGSIATTTLSLNDSNLEISKVPTFAGRISYIFNKNRVGVSAIWSRLIFNNSPDLQREIYGLNGFFDLNPTNTLSIRAEGYFAQNLGNTGAFALGVGTLAASMKEWGGYVSARWKFAERNALYGGLGYATILNSDELANASLTGTLSGLQSNTVIKIGLEQQLVEKLTWFLETTHYHTFYKPNGDFAALTVSSGFHLPF